MDPLDEDGTQFNYIQDSNSIIRTSMRVGFPAYAIKQFIQIKESFESDTEINKSDYYIDSKYVDYDINPFFNGLEEKSKDDNEIIVLQSIALNIIIVNGDNLEHEEKSWNSLKQCMEFLDTIKGEDLKNELQAKIDKIISECNANAVLAHSKIDQIRSLVNEENFLKGRICIKELIDTISPV